MIPVAALVVGTVRIMSVMSITMAPALACVFTALAILDVSPPAYAVYAAAASVLIVWKHRPNMERLIAGTEPKLGRGGSKRSASEEGAPSPS
jgi:glycerol-3-phosphate acyltransferase PlsY